MPPPIFQVYVTVMTREFLPKAPESLIKALSEATEENAQEMQDLEHSIEDRIANRTRARVH